MTTEQKWTWVQPRSREDLLARLLAARDLSVPERERENLCAVAHAEIAGLSEALRDANRLIRERDKALGRDS